LQEKLNEKFPGIWREILSKEVLFYKQLNEPERVLFEKRVQRFLATKKIEGIDTEIDDSIRLFVASSAIIPTFAFPEYNYPDVHSVLIYPGSFDEQFQTQNFDGNKENIIGMVGNRFQNGVVILSKPDLIAAFDGLPHKSNVGIHEFVHLLDKEDGVIDGIPELLMEHKYVGPWLHEIKNEMSRIEKGNSDINPYALTNNAEFLAVVSEYFFNSPEKFKNKHPELYQFLSTIYNKKELIQNNS
jgi:Mlc titration factor MtfA (ptsG expression regulator)